MKYLIIAFTVLFTNKIIANENFKFVNDCIQTFHILDKATLEFYDHLENNNNQDELKKSTMNYVSKLMETQNILLIYSKSEFNDIKEVSTDIRKLMSDLVKENYSFLSSISNSKLTKKELIDKRTKFKSKLDFVTSFFNQITLGICMTLSREKKENELNMADKQFSKLTLNERNGLNQIMIENFGKTIKKGKNEKSKTHFEYSTRLIYEFINLDWEFRKE